MLLLEHENRYREAYVTLHALGGRCMTAKRPLRCLDRQRAERLVRAAGHPGAYHKAAWSCAVSGTGRIPDDVWGCPHVKEWKPGFPGIIIPIPGSLPGQVIMSLSDGMGSGETAAQESRKVIELLQQLLETGFSRPFCPENGEYNSFINRGWNSIRPCWICAVWTLQRCLWRP